VWNRKYLAMLSAICLLVVLMTAQAEGQASAYFEKAFNGAPIKAGRWHFQSNPWVNLHQRLLYEAVFKDAHPALIKGDDLEAWNKAVDDYRVLVIKRDPIADGEMISVNEKLSATPIDRVPDNIPKSFAAILSRIMPVYKLQQWPADDAMNQFCINAARPLIESAGEELAAEHSRFYGAPFPTRILVDVTALGWQFGAYTVGSRDYAHVIFQAPDNPADQGQMVLESLLHEPSHVFIGSRTDVLGSDITRLSRELNLRPMANLWHAILFYTSGELTRRAYVKRGILDYKPIITRMYSGPFKGYQKSLETHWQAYLDGKVSRDEALKNILIETSPTRKSPS
jgi:hypothetical protein